MDQEFETDYSTETPIGFDECPDDDYQDQE